jgi:predicted protein tyrosine phosphatase
MRALFLCSQNRLRSPTAERIFSGREGLEVESAGLDAGAENPVSPELIEWAEIIFVMEKAHKNKLDRKFRPFLKGKRIVCLNIPDDFEYMDPKLISILNAKAGPFLFRR